MNSDTTTESSVIIVNKDEFEFLKWYEYLTPDDIVELIEHRALLEKYLRIRLRQVSIDLALLKYIGKEKQAYDYMEILSEAIKWIDKQIQEYKNYTASLEKEAGN